MTQSGHRVTPVPKRRSSPHMASGIEASSLASRWRLPVHSLKSTHWRFVSTGEPDLTFLEGQVTAGFGRSPKPAIVNAALRSQGPGQACDRSRGWGAERGERRGLRGDSRVGYALVPTLDQDRREPRRSRGAARRPARYPTNHARACACVTVPLSAAPFTSSGVAAGSFRMRAIQASGSSVMVGPPGGKSAGPTWPRKLERGR